jgi:formate C-acetyltransferase
MKEQHTTAAGFLPFDHHYGVGYKVGHEGWSPFERINKLRETWGELPWNIDIDRLRLITESYKEHEDDSVLLKCAYGFENITKKVPLRLYDGELIVGEIAAPAKEAPIFPEFSVEWIIDEITNSPFEERANDQFYIKSEEDRKEILELCEYWRGKTVNNLIEARYTDELKLGNECGASIYASSDYRFGGIGHTACSYARVLSLGFDGLKAEAQLYLDALTEADADYTYKKDLYTAMIIMHEASKNYILRYAKLAEDAAVTETDEKRKWELESMAANCKQISGGPATTYWQALQLFNFATTLIEIEGNGQSISYGRMDQWLNPYYEADMKNGTITKEFALELLEAEFVKLNNQTKLKDKSTVVSRNGRGFGGESLTFGGMDVDGNDATNDITMMLLEACAHTRMLSPWTCVRMHAGTPIELKIKTAEVIRCGFGHPKVYNDDPAIEAYLEKGATLEEARNYSVVGCVEPTLEGKEQGWVGAGMINGAKVMELALNHGRLLHTDIQLGPDAGGLESFTCYEEVLEAVDKQFAYATKLSRDCNDILDFAQRERKPVPLLSSMFEDPTRRGMDITKGGAKYNGTGIQTSGAATAADILSTIKQLVFDEKTYTGEQLLQAVRDNWEGHEKLYHLVNGPKVHHFGNDDDYADDQFKFIFETICKNMKTGTNHPRGGKYNPGVYSVNANVGLGLRTNASIDGRIYGEPISENMSPVHTLASSHDICGPTAVLNSVGKVNHAMATNGTLLNIRFPEEAVTGIEGRDNLVGYTSELMSQGLTHCQYNVMSAETMKAAQKNPKEYKDMLVRVAGYSAYFVDLGIPLQNDLISRTEFNF